MREGRHRHGDVGDVNRGLASGYGVHNMDKRGGPLYIIQKQDHLHKLTQLRRKLMVAFTIGNDVRGYSSLLQLEVTSFSFLEEGSKRIYICMCTTSVECEGAKSGKLKVNL